MLTFLKSDYLFIYCFRNMKFECSECSDNKVFFNENSFNEHLEKEHFKTEIDEDQVDIKVEFEESFQDIHLKSAAGNKPEIHVKVPQSHNSKPVVIPIVKHFQTPTRSQSSLSCKLFCLCLHHINLGLQHVE